VAGKRISQLLVKPHCRGAGIQHELSEAAGFEILLELVHQHLPQAFSLMARRHGHLSNPRFGRREPNRDNASHEIIAVVKEAEVALILLVSQVLVAERQPQRPAKHFFAKLALESVVPCSVRDLSELHDSLSGRELSWPSQRVRKPDLPDARQFSSHAKGIA